MSSFNPRSGGRVKGPCLCVCVHLYLHVCVWGGGGQTGSLVHTCYTRPVRSEAWGWLSPSYLPTAIRLDWGCYYGLTIFCTTLKYVKQDKSNAVGAALISIFFMFRCHQSARLFIIYLTVFYCSPAALFSSDSLCTVSLCRCVMSVSLSFSPQVSFFLFIVFVVYTMLPFSMRDAIIASVLTSVSHTIVLSVCLSTTADHMEPVVWQVRGSNTQ